MKLTSERSPIPRHAALAAWLGAALFLGACQGTAPQRAAAPAVPAASPAPAGDPAFAALAERLLMDGLRRHPEAAIAAGLYDRAAEVTLPDADRRAADLAFSRDALQALQAVDVNTLPPHQRIEHGLLSRRHERTIWALQTLREWEWNPASYNVAPPIGQILNTPYAPEEQRLRTVSARLAQVPAFFAAARASVLDPTVPHLELAATQSRGALRLLGPALQQRVAASSLSAAEKAEFETRLAAARAAIQDWAAWADATRTAFAALPRSFRLGPQIYEAKFDFDIQAGFSANELYVRALAEKDRLHREMDGHTQRLWPKYFAGTDMPEDRLQRVAQMVERLSRRHVSREEFVPEIRRQIPLLAEFVRRHDLLEQDPTRPLVVRETPPYMRGGGAIASVSAPGPFNPTAETYYNVTPLTDFSPEQAASLLREYNHWVLQILNIHEAIPGHYTQLLHANKSPSKVKALIRNGAMVEGWAVYAERMMLEAGWGNDEPEMWLMHGKWLLRVVCNAIVDYAVHNLGMTEAQALDLLQREAFQEPAEAANKWRRATLTSVQLTSYFAGYSAIMELRGQQRAALGERFVLRDFHNRFLSFGAAPVAAIAELMAPPGAPSGAAAAERALTLGDR
jgi:uncharacterized protein (DUF885 family)